MWFRIKCLYDLNNDVLAKHHPKHNPKHFLQSTCVSKLHMFTLAHIKKIDVFSIVFRI